MSGERFENGIMALVTAKNIPTLPPGAIDIPDDLMDEHLQLVGVVGLVACLILGIVVIALCVVLFCQKCRSRDSQSLPFANRDSGNSENSNNGDDPPDYDWCAENAGYRPDQLDNDSLAHDLANDEVPPGYETAVGNGGFVALDVNQLTASEAYKNLTGAGLGVHSSSTSRSSPS